MILLFKILKGSTHITNKVLKRANKTDKTAVAINSELTMIAFILRFFFVLIRKLYEKRRAR